MVYYVYKINNNIICVMHRTYIKKYTQLQISPTLKYVLLPPYSVNRVFSPYHAHELKVIEISLHMLFYIKGLRHFAKRKRSCRRFSARYRHWLWSKRWTYFRLTLRFTVYDYNIFWTARFFAIHPIQICAQRLGISRCRENNHRPSILF